MLSAILEVHCQRNPYPTPELALSAITQIQANTEKHRLGTHQQVLEIANRSLCLAMTAP